MNLLNAKQGAAAVSQAGAVEADREKSSHFLKIIAAILERGTSSMKRETASGSWIIPEFTGPANAILSTPITKVPANRFRPNSPAWISFYGCSR
jgi:hypothetical protein